MRKTRKYARHLLPVAVTVALLSLTACGLGGPSPTPTMSVNAIFTAAFQTLSVQRATQLALTPPTSTPTDTPAPTIPPPPTLGSLPAFGSPTTAAGGGVQGCDSSAYIADVTVPDGTVMTPGKKFTKTWTVMNNGTCDWTTAYKLSLVSGEAMGGTSVQVPAAVPVGQQVQISVPLTAPTAVGSYTGSWRLQNAAGQSFGNVITVVIKVAAAESPTETPTTSVPSATATTATP